MGRHRYQNEEDDRPTVADLIGQAEYLTAREVAKQLNVSERTVRRYIHADLIEVIRLGSDRAQIRVTPEAVADFVARQTKKPDDGDPARWDGNAKWS